MTATLGDVNSSSKIWCKMTSLESSMNDTIASNYDLNKLIRNQLTPSNCCLLALMFNSLSSTLQNHYSKYFTYHNGY